MTTPEPLAAVWAATLCAVALLCTALDGAGPRRRARRVLDGSRRMSRWPGLRRRLKRWGGGVPEGEPARARGPRTGCADAGSDRGRRQPRGLRFRRAWRPGGWDRRDGSCPVGADCREGAAGGVWRWLGGFLRGPGRWCVPGGGVLAVATGSVVPLVAGVVAVPLVGRVLRRRAERAAAERAAAAVGALCAALAGDLRAGRPPHIALGETVEAAGWADTPELAAPARLLLSAVRFGGDVPQALRTAARQSEGTRGLAAMAACWQVAVDGGAGLAGALDRVAAALRAEADQRDDLRAQLAGPRSTAALLALLPVFGVTLGTGLGAHPARTLLHTPTGLACLMTGALLEWAGLAWTARIIRTAESGPAASTRPRAVKPAASSSAGSLRPAVVARPPAMGPAWPAEQASPPGSPLRTAELESWGAPAPSAESLRPAVVARPPSGAPSSGSSPARAWPARPTGGSERSEAMAVAVVAVGGVVHSLGTVALGAVAAAAVAGTAARSRRRRRRVRGLGEALGRGPVRGAERERWWRRAEGPVRRYGPGPAVGLGLAMALGGGLGALAGLVAALGVGRWLKGRQRAAESREVTPEPDPAQLPLCADLIAACLAAGATPGDAAGAVGACLGGPLGDALIRARAELRLGGDPAECWLRFGGAQPAARELGRCLARASTIGSAPVAEMTRLAADLRAAHGRAALAAARRAAVLATAPLGLCFLPAFLLVGVAPVVIGLAGTILGAGPG